MAVEETETDAAPAEVEQTAAATEQSLADWLREGPFALALASSFFGFYAHAGAVQGACEARLLRSTRLTPPSAHRV